MRKNPASQSGIFNLRILLALALCAVGSLLAMLSLAAMRVDSTASSHNQAATSIAANTWTQHVHDDLPEARNNPGIAYDAVSGKAVLFGGQGLDGALNDTWTWDGTRWTRVEPALSPPARFAACMVYDAARGQVVLFGGAYVNSDGTHIRISDTWIWDGSTWTQRNPSTSPPARAYASAAFDVARGKVVMFGGDSQTTPGTRNDTWTWDGNTWTDATPTLPLASPVGRYGASMAYLPSIAKVVLFGGFTNLAFGGVSNGHSDETWTWDGASWTLQTPAAKPTARLGAALALDKVRGELVLFGGQIAQTGQNFEDTWIWNGSNWIPRTPLVRPTPRHYVGMAFDEAHGVVVLFGGLGRTGKQDDTWAWNGSDWSLLKFDPDPSARWEYSAADHAATGRVVMFGGVDGTQRIADTWTWDGGAWTRLNLALSPSARTGAGMEPYPPNNTAVLFGGFDGVNFLNDTWIWDGSSWTQISPSNAPSTRSNPQMTYDPVRGHLLLFGGFAAPSGIFENDTWIWDGVTWTRLFPATSPPGRANGGIAFDPNTDNVILFGGYNGDNFGDMWSWDGTNWTPLAPATLPVGRHALSMVTDFAAGKVLLFGGRSNVAPVYYKDTWLWDGLNWTLQSPPVVPRQRRLQRLVYHSTARNTLLFSGELDINQRNDTWTWNGALLEASVVSRKTHGSAGPFDVDLPLTGTAGIECRTGGASGNHQVVVTFAGPVTFTSATVTSGSGTVASSSASGNQATVNLDNVANAQTIGLTLFGVTVGASTGNLVIPMSMLTGDTTGNGAVNSSDIAQTKADSGKATNSSNFRRDVTINGVINSSDIALVKSKSGTGLPP